MVTSVRRPRVAGQIEKKEVAFLSHERLLDVAEEVFAFLVR
jgi:hypothetical protein